MATYYVTTSGNDSNDGLSEVNAFATPGKAGGVATASGDIIYVKSGTYLLTSTTSNISGGRVTLSTGVKMEGYSTTPGDQAAKPIIRINGQTGINVVTLSAGFNVLPPAVISMEFDGNSASGNNGLTASTYTVNVRNCIFRNFLGVSNGGVYASASRSHIFNCLAVNCGIGFQSCGGAHYCRAVSCTGKGFFNIQTASRCFAINNGGSGFDFGASLNWNAVGCIAKGNTGHGFTATNDIGALIDCIATKNSLFGAATPAGNTNKGLTLVNFAHYLNTSGGIDGTIVNAYNTIALSADPFVDDANNDFNINDTAGGGALLRAATLVMP